MPRLRVDLDSGEMGVIISTIDGLRDHYRKSGQSVAVYSLRKKEGGFYVDGDVSLQDVQTALGKYVPRGIRVKSIEVVEEAPSGKEIPEDYSNLWSEHHRVRAELEEREKHFQKLKDELKRAEGELKRSEGELEGQKDAQAALTQIKERLIKEGAEEKSRREELERRYGDLFKQFDSLATTRADPKDAGITKVLSFATELKKYDERFEQILSGAGGLSLTDMNDIHGMSLIDYANKVLAPHGVSVSSEQELDSLGSVPSREETNNYETAKQEIKFLEDLESGKISGIPKHLLPALTSAIDRQKDEGIVKKYEAKLKASGEAVRIRSVYQKASEVKSAREEIRGQSLRVPYFIVNGEDGDNRTIEVFAPSGVSTGVVSRAVAKLGAGAIAVLPPDSKTEEPVARGRFVQIASHLPKPNYDTPAVVELQRKVARQILDLAESELNALGLGVSVMETSVY